MDELSEKLKKEVSMSLSRYCCHPSLDIQLTAGDQRLWKRPVQFHNRISIRFQTIAVVHTAW
jgi:hypothetical protein